MLSQNDDVLELEEVGELEEQVNEMAEKIADYRRTISVQLKTTVSSILIAQRPVLVTRFNEGSESQSVSSGDPSSGAFLIFSLLNNNVVRLFCQLVVKLWFPISSFLYLDVKLLNMCLFAVISKLILLFLGEEKSNRGPIWLIYQAKKSDMDPNWFGIMAYLFDKVPILLIL